MQKDGNRGKMKTYMTRILNLVFKEFPLYYISRIVSLLPNHGVTCRIRGKLVGWCFEKHGKNFQLAEAPIITYPEKMELGDNVYIAHRAYINAKAGIIINNDVTIGPNCILASTNHVVQQGKVLNEGSQGTIVIGSGTWIGGNVTITAGTSIGNNCIVAAGSVVTKSFPSGLMIGGVPAHIIKELERGN